LKKQADALVVTRYATISDWLIISGMRKTQTYAALRRGDLRAVKDGKRTLIDVEHGLARLAALPAAKFAPTAASAHR
jgi:hypothetical protein